MSKSSFAERVIRKELGIGSTEPTLSEFADGFFTDKDPTGFINRQNKRHKTYADGYYEDCQARLENHILPYHGTLPLSKIKDFMIEDLILSLKSVKNPDKDLDDSSKNKVLSVYRSVLREAVRQGYIENNPADKVMDVREVKGNRESFTEQEIALLFPADTEKLIQNWYNVKWAAYFCVLKDTGFRPGEAAALKKSNIFFNMSGSSLNGLYSDEEVSWRNHNVINKRIKTSGTKNGAKSKQGFVTEQTAELLKKLMENLKTEYVFELVPEDMPKSHCRTKNEIHYIYPELSNERLRRTCKNLGIDLNGRTQYCFRHYFNTVQYARLPDAARLLLMGHTKNRNEYLHLTPIESLERVLAIDGVKEVLGVEGK